MSGSRRAGARPSPRGGGGTRASRKAAQAAAREADQARSRRTFVRRVLPGAAILVVLVVALAALVSSRGDDAPAPSTASASTDRDQRTLLVQVVPAAGDPSVANALTAAGADSGTFTAIPSRLITDLPGAGRTTLDQSTVDADGAVAAQALADQLGVIVDGSWVLTEAALATLVTEVGGVTVDVDVDVTSEVGGTKTVSIVKGPDQRLGGTQAVELATFLGEEEAEQARMSRFTAVWSALVANLPQDADAIAALVTAAPGSVTTFTPEELASYLASMRRASADDAVAFPSLPTVVVDTGGTSTSYRLDTKKVSEFVAAGFAGSVPATPPGGVVTVLVQNGVGTPGLADQARSMLVAKGLTYKSGGNATRFGYNTSVVLINDVSEKARRQGALVTEALGLPESALRQAAQGQSVADVMVILGADFGG